MLDICFSGNPRLTSGNVYLPATTTGRRVANMEPKSCRRAKSLATETAFVVISCRRDLWHGTRISPELLKSQRTVRSPNFEEMTDAADA